MKLPFTFRWRLEELQKKYQEALRENQMLWDSAHDRNRKPKFDGKFYRKKDGRFASVKKQPKTGTLFNG